jgi:hypothetical protein
MQQDANMIDVDTDYVSGFLVAHGFQTNHAEDFCMLGIERG